MDEAVFAWFNYFNGRYDTLDSALRISRLAHVKSVPFMAVIWALWFLPQDPVARTEMREKLCAILLCTLPINAFALILADMLPFVPRPMHTPGIEMNFFSDQGRAVLDGWSAFPSGHTALFFSLAIAVFLLHRGLGLFLIAWCLIIVSAPRVIMGLHWPSDILGGAVLGTFLILVFLWPVARAVRFVGLVRFMESKEYLGYPLLFLVTFEVASVFEFTKYIVLAVLN